MTGLRSNLNIQRKLLPLLALMLHIFFLKMGLYFHFVIADLQIEWSSF